MKARAVAAWVAACLSVVLLGSNPVYRGLALLAGLNFLIAHRRPGARLRPLVLLVVAGTAVSVLVSVLLSHTGAHVIGALPAWLPIAGGPLTLESLLYGLSAGLGIAAAAIAVAPLSMVTEGQELVDALPRRLHRAGTTLAVALNLVPAIGRSVATVREAQLMRGWRARGPRSMVAIVVPVTLTTFETSIQLAEAMEARAYGSGPRTTAFATPWSTQSILTVATAAVVLAGMIAGRVGGALVDWYPYPSPMPPSASPLLVVLCFLLVAPALAPRVPRVPRPAPTHLEPTEDGGD
ncbi:MAG: energy-coupling factor transport system permease protein [Chloroflexota bacterium]|nr:energy-coupling factor transport system permease protein [Chloroflexota bacterium]